MITMKATFEIENLKYRCQHEARARASEGENKEVKVTESSKNIRYLFIIGSVLNLNTYMRTGTSRLYF